MFGTVRRQLIVSACLLALTLAAFWPVRQAGFTNFDDPIYVTNNPQVFHGLSRSAVVWAFTTIHGSNWHPLTWLSHMLDCQVFGENAAGHHLVNLALHALNTLLLFTLLWWWTGATWRPALVAALFAVHPLHVESVAWVSERKDVLSACFFLFTLLAYTRYARGKSNVQSLKSKVGEAGGAQGSETRSGSVALWYGVSLGCFALGLLSKPMLVTLPFLLVLLDFWPLQRLTLPKLRMQLGPSLREKVPFFALGLASSVVTFWAQKTGGAVVTMDHMPVSDRLLNALAAVWAYSVKTFWPVRLAAFYPFPSAVPWGRAVAGGLVLMGGTAAALRLLRRAPYVGVGWLWFIGMLVPVIGLVQVGSQAYADRYTYLPHIGLFIALVWGTSQATARARWCGPLLSAGAGAVLMVCCVLTRVQAGYWKDSITLFSHALAVTQGNALAEHNLGHALSLAGNQAEAIPHLSEAVRLKPGYPQAYYNRGNAYGVQRRLEEALSDYRLAIHYKPDYEQAYCSLAKGLALQGKLEEARTNFLAALRCKPDYSEAHTKLGNVLLLQGEPAKALEHLRTAVQCDPTYDEGWYYLGADLARQKQFAEAIAAFRRAVSLKPDYASALNDLGWLLATLPDSQLRSPPEAVRCAQRACDLTGYNDPMYLDTLGVARSEAGQLTEAIAVTEKAAALAAAAKDDTLVAQMQNRLALYRGGHSYTQGLPSGALR